MHAHEVMEHLQTATPSPCMRGPRGFGGEVGAPSCLLPLLLLQLPKAATLVLLTSVFRVNGCYPRKPPGLTAGGFLGATVNIEPSRRGRSADDAVGTKDQVRTSTRANVADLVFLLVRTHPERGLTNPTCQCRVKVMTDHLRMTPGMTPEQREEVRAARRERDHREAQAAAQHSRDRRARQSDEQNAADDAEKERLRDLFR
ncbi:hypothetical protein SEA_SCENTAE_135 [Gordonia phage SCentae]|nr:hypothetical protein SEA_SCENTAE_135 [Gordonia phage SCentae]